MEKGLSVEQMAHPLEQRRDARTHAAANETWMERGVHEQIPIKIAVHTIGTMRELHGKGVERRKDARIHGAAKEIRRDRC